MLLQKIVQLHILLSAAPVLAGWVLGGPTAAALPAPVLLLVAQNNVKIFVPPIDTRRPAVLLRSCPHAVCRLTEALPSTLAALHGSGSAVAAFSQQFSSYPHGPRAP